MISPPAQERFQLIDLPAEKRRARFGHDVAVGLNASPRRLSCCYFYDRVGSRLFETICELPEYYLTRAETAILHSHAEKIADVFQGATDLVELGSGNATKTRILLEAFTRRYPAQRYIPIDICRTVLEESSVELLRAFPRLQVVAIAGEYQDGLRQIRPESNRRKLILWLGSNIGNLDRQEAARFLVRIRETLATGDRVLVGIDLRKDRAILEPAYDDPAGVTAAFNRNLLCRINRELGGNFEVRTFQHRAIYNETEGRIEMYLVSDCHQQVHIDQLEMDVSFAAGEAIHTENSYKYSPEEIDKLAKAADLSIQNAWTDPDNRFSLNLFGRLN